ncbi:MAG: fibronectin type III domain-containing protein, partial [Thermoguttaceae bacterium]|nr:fibronectin type III domain-containing protein [Thermoguttaceae bacterium]
MKFFDASRYASPLRKALDKKENAPRNLRFETLENRALLSVTPIDNLELATASAEIAPAQAETPSVDLSALAVSNATTENVVENESNDTLETAQDLGLLTKTTTVEAVANARLNSDYYKVTFEVDGTDEHSIVLAPAWIKPTGDTAINLNLFLLDESGAQIGHSTQGNVAQESISLDGVKAGTYYIHVAQAGSSATFNHDGEGNYALTITPPAIPQDDYEENDAFEDAYDLGVLGATTLDALTGLNQEYDYFKFTTAGTADDAHFVEMTYTQAANANLTLELLDAEGNTLANAVENATTKTISLKDLPAGDYYVRVCNVDAQANKAIAYSLQIEAPQVAPAAPTNFDTNGDEATHNYATLVWNGVFGETGYELRYTTDVDKADAEATWTTAGTVGADVATFDTGALAYGTADKFQIRAVNAFGESAWVDLEFSTVAKPEAPTGLKASVLDAENRTVTLTWDDLANELGYVVDLLDADGAVVAQSSRLEADTTTWTTPELALGTTYQFKVTAINNAGDATSELFEFTTENVPTAPTGENWLLVPAPQPTATLSWSAVENASDAEAVTDYVVTIYEQVDGADGDAIFRQTVAASQTALTLEAGLLEKGASYRFDVVAVNAYGDSAPSTGENAYVTIGDVPAQPIDLEYEFNHYAKNAILTWAAVEGADAYVVEQLGADGEWTPVAPPVGNPETTETTWESGVFDFGTSHAFRVVAKNAYGSSVASDAVSFTIQDEPTVVTSLEDGDLNLLDDVTTLREALRFAQDGDEIVFAEDLRGGTITLTGGPLSIMEKEISVRGFVDETGAPELTIDGDHKDMIFVVANTRASFFGLSVVNGYASYAKYGGGAVGGGFSVDNANATFTNVDVIGCHADVYGGGIYISSNVEAPGQGKSTLTNVRILDNASDNGESSGQGGGLYATGGFMGGEIEMTNVEISGNQARADGGGVYLNDITSTLTNVKITDNIAQGNGGAFYANAPDHTFISNLTGYPLLLISTKLTNVEITGNQAYQGFGFYADEFDVEELSLRNVTLADNVGTQEDASADVYLANGVATFYNSIVDGDVQGEEYAANAYNTLSSYADWANATDEGVVNYVLNEGDSVFAEGSYALAADSVARDKGDNAYVPKTLTTDLAGNARISGLAVDLGAYEIDKEAPSTVVTTSEDVVDARDGKISLREAIQYAEAGATITFADDVATVTLGGTELTIDKAITINGDVTVDANEQSRVFSVADNTSVEFVGLTITGGYTGFEGGGVFVGGYASATFTNVDITGNAANQGGGVFLLNGASATFTNVEITGNTADFNGGGVSVSGVGVSATFTNVKITGNAANQGGGVFVVNGASAAFANVEITGNTANQGGAFAVVNGASATFANATIVEADVQTIGSTTIQLLGSTATFYNSIVDAEISALAATANAYNALSSFTAWTNANEEGVVNYVIDATKPLFTDAENDDYTLAAGSQAINKGDNAYVAETITTDLAGNARFNGTVDLGAYESEGVAPQTPTGLTVVVNAAETLSATLTWDADETATSYVVTLFDADGQTVATTTVDVNNWTIGPLASGTSYVATVVAVNAYGESEAATVEFATVEASSTVVTTTEDVVDEYDGKISLREAIQYAEAGATIAFAETLKGQTIVLAGTELTVDKALTIQGFVDETGAPQITVDANAQSRVFNVLRAGTTEAPVAFVGLTITGGNATDGAGVKVFNGAASFTNVKLTGNAAQGGGAVAVALSSATFTNVEIAENVAQIEGGGVLVNNGSATFTNVEITGNTANQGGVSVSANAVATFRNATIADNGTFEVFVRNVSTTTFYNSIVDGAVVNADGTATTNAYNTLSSFTAWTNANEEGVVNYVLNEGDSVFAEGSYALAADSVAINKGDNAYVAETITTDLAGNARISGIVDLGAYEYQGVAPQAPTGLTATVDASPEPTATLTWNAVEDATSYVVTLFDADGETVATATVDANAWTTGVLAKGTYYFEVVAKNVYGESEVATSETFVVDAV